MSTPLKVLIVDDEPPARARLERLIGELPGWTVAGSCASAAEALEQAARLAPAVVLLDIRMPGPSGLDCARRLSRLDAPPAVVFTTAYDRYALEAFEFRAADYLLKPVRRDRLLAALTHAARLVAPRAASTPGATGGAQPRRHLAVRVRDALKLIPIGDILYFHAEQKYVTVRHLRGEDLIDESLRQLEEELAQSFVRAHRSLLVAIEHVEALERDASGGYRLRLRQSGDTLPVSRRQLAELKRRLAGERPCAGM